MDRPNVIVIMSDEMKATASHLYGSTFCQTPSLERMAREGVLFRHAYTPHPLCVPARVSLWTGQYPHSTGARRNETWMPPDALHAFRIWKDLGYRTGLIGKNHCFEAASDLALFDVWCEIGHVGLPRGSSARGMEWCRPTAAIEAAHAVRRNMPRTNPHLSYAESDFPLEDYGTSVIAAQTVRFLEQHRHEPFVLWVSFPDPHTPYEAPTRYMDLFRREVITLPPWRADEFADAPERNQVLHAILGAEEDPIEQVYGAVGVYHAMTRLLDDGVGQILDGLDALGLRESTIVVFCSDHGDFAGEHGMFLKGGVFYDCLTRIPLIVSWPGQVAAGQVDESMANLIDVVPTVFQLQGIPVPRAMHGQPLPTVTNAAPREATFSEYGAGGSPFTLADLGMLPKPYGVRALMWSLRWREAEGRRKLVRMGEWKYVHDAMGDKDELYNLREDPWELCNLVDEAQHRDVVTSLARRLADWSISTEDARPVPLPERPMLPG